MALVCLWTLGRASAEVDVRATKTFDLRSYSVEGDLTQFLNENPAFLNGNELTQSLRLEASGNVNDKVSVDIRLDDSGLNPDEQRMKIEVAGRVWNLVVGKIPVTLPGNRFLMGQRTGMGLFVKGEAGRDRIELFAQRPEGRSHRNVFEGRGSLQEYVLTDRSGLQNPLVVVGSDKVTLDGRRLERGVDYEIDYLEGAVLLSRTLLPLDPRSRLTVEFEEGGSGSGFASTVFGGRYTRRFGKRPREPDRDVPAAGTGPAGSYVSLGFAVEADDRSAPPSASTTDMSPGRLGVFELQGRAEVSRDLTVTGAAAVSARDRDTWTDAGSEDPTGAFEVGAAFSPGRFELRLSRAVIDPGFAGVGLDRFTRGAERSDLARDGASTLAEALWKGATGARVETRFREARTNLAGTRAEAEEATRVGAVQVDLPEVAGGKLGLGWLVEDAETRAAGSADFVDSRRERLTAVQSRQLGAVKLQVSGELEDTVRAADASESYALAGVELTGPGEARIGWSAGGSLRETARGAGSDPTRIARDAHGGVSTELRDDLTLGVDFRHLRETRLDDTDPAAPPSQEANTGEARLRLNGRKLEGELHATGEVRSRVLVDRLTPWGTPQQDLSPNQRLPQTAVAQDPVLTRGFARSLTWRPVDAWEVGVSGRDKFELDTATGEHYSRDRSRDGRVSWSPDKYLRARIEVGSGDSFSDPSRIDRSNWDQRFEVTRSLESGLSISATRTRERLDDRIEESRSEAKTKDRLGAEKQVRRNLLAKGGLSTGRERTSADLTTTGVDLSLEWARPRLGGKVAAGVEVQGVTGEDASGGDVETARKRWFMSAAGKLGEGGFVDLDVDLKSSGEDGRGGQGYRGLTTQLKLGLEF